MRIARGFLVIMGMLVVANVAVAAVHSADTSENGRISLSELLRVVQLFNVGGYSCDTSESESDGYLPLAGGDTTCLPHGSDYEPRDWRIELAELLRLVQFFNIGRYRTDAAEKDGFSPCTNEDLDPHLLPVPGDDDGNFLTPAEEAALGIAPGGSEGTPIGIQLGLAAAAAIAAFDIYSPFDNEVYLHYLEDGGIEYAALPVDRPYFLMNGEAECGSCSDPFVHETIPISIGKTLNTQYIGNEQSYTLVNPLNDTSLAVSEVSLVFLHYGSFSYFGTPCGNEDDCRYDDGQTRMDTVALLALLGLLPE